MTGALSAVRSTARPTRAEWGGPSLRLDSIAQAVGDLLPEARVRACAAAATLAQTGDAGPVMSGRLRSEMAAAAVDVAADWLSAAGLSEQAEAVCARGDRAALVAGGVAAWSLPGPVVSGRDGAGLLYAAAVAAGSRLLAAILPATPTLATTIVDVAAACTSLIARSAGTDALDAGLRRQAEAVLARLERLALQPSATADGAIVAEGTGGDEAGRPVGEPLAALEALGIAGASQVARPGDAPPDAGQALEAAVDELIAAVVEELADSTVMMPRMSGVVTTCRRCTHRWRAENGQEEHHDPECPVPRLRVALARVRAADPLREGAPRPDADAGLHPSHCAGKAGPASGSYPGSPRSTSGPASTMPE